MRFTLTITCIALVAVPIGASAQLNKCVNERGQITYSDRGCERNPKATVTAKAPPAPPNKAINGKLSEALAIQLTMYTARPDVILDHLAECALAAKDLVFKTTQQTGSSKRVFTGGRAQFCAMARDAVEAVQDGGISVTVKVGKIQVEVNADSTEATAKFQQTATLSRKGQNLVTTQCDHEETMRVYGDVVLYSSTNNACVSTR